MYSDGSLHDGSVPGPRGTTHLLPAGRGEQATELKLDLEAAGLSAEGEYTVRDVVAKKDLGRAAGHWSAEVGRHAVAFVVLTPAE